MIIFENDGILEEELITSFGVSCKDGDNPIGYFGTGLKYAISILIREGCDIMIASGGKKYLFSKESKTIRGKEFDFITLNGKQLPFTTELGKKWVLWQAFRELYSNAKDEGGKVYKGDISKESTKNKTLVFVKGGAFENCYNERNSIFSEGADILNDHALVEVTNGSGSFFCKGVKVWDYEGNNSKYNYNDTAGYCDLTEDRQTKYQWQVWNTMARAVVTMTDAVMLENVITADTQFIESSCNFSGLSETPTQEFMDAMVIHHDNCKNEEMVNFWKSHKPKSKPREIELNDIDKAILDEAIQSVTLSGFGVKDYPIKIVDRLQDNALGLAHCNTIWLSKDVFTVGGLAMVKATLIEEWAHLKYGYTDCERDMQNYLFEQIVRLSDTLERFCKDNYSRKAT